MKQFVALEELKYTGEQLRSSFAHTTYNIPGDSIVAFCGPCDVKKEYMVDLEDLQKGARIYSESMLHFIVEHHDTDLERAILRQLVLTNIVMDMLNRQPKPLQVRRIHTDLYDGDAKLTVSVATVTPLSSLIHFGINIESSNTPVKSRGLADYKIDPYDFARLVVKEYASEIDRLNEVRCKVRWVD
ncbi:MAG: DUF366 family protein [candidate division WOR-3 bacterium]|nr:MAG: DUF366 family protein [candidate division WOR-3 bacterium]